MCSLEKETTLPVKVIGPAGQPVAGSFVDAYASPGTSTSAWSGQGVTGESGEGTIRGLLPGVYTLVGRSKGFPPAFREGVEVPSEESSGPVVLQFTAGGGLDILILDAGGSPVPEIEPILLDDRERDVTNFYRAALGQADTFWLTDESGRLHVEGVLPGAYQVKVNSGGKWESRSVTVSVDKPAEVVLVVQATDSE